MRPARGRSAAADVTVSDRVGHATSASCRSMLRSASSGLRASRRDAGRRPASPGVLCRVAAACRGPLVLRRRGATVGTTRRFTLPRGRVRTLTSTLRGRGSAEVFAGPDRIGIVRAKRRG